MGIITQKKRLSAALDAARTSNRRKPRPPRQDPLPHFPQPVTAADVALWMSTYGQHIAPRLIDRYVTLYDVPGKIARAKDTGQWPPVANPAP